MRDSSIADRAEADLVGVVDRRRAEGASVAVACREAGISTSTYYRRRRTGAALAGLVAEPLVVPSPPPATVGLMASPESRSWPFTARAPFYWDQVFADELSDSFVRREFGRGPVAAPSRGALTALAKSEFGGALSRGLSRVQSFLPKRSPEALKGPLAAAVFFALVAAAAMLTVSVASDPAAWIDPAQTRVADYAVSATLTP